MATQETIQTENVTILDVIAAADDGMLLDEIAEKTGLDLNRRTLQRRLKGLIDQGDVRTTGAARSRRYLLTEKKKAERPPVDTTSSGKAQEAQADFFVPVSKPGGKILSYVTRPLASRDATAYDRAFLDSYRPNETFYLTTAERKHLRDKGTTRGTVQAAGTYALQILNRLLIDLSWNSSRLEGNTYSLLETQRLIELGRSTENKQPRETQMILNHKAAIEFVVRSAAEEEINRLMILNLHALLAENLLDDPAAAGRLRHDAVGISGTNYLPLEIPQIIEESFATIIAKARQIVDPFEQAFFLMVQLPYLQPFIDVNKRVSRLALNIPLIRANLAPLSFISVPDSTYTYGVLGVYELRKVDLLKDVFIWAYEKSAARYIAVRQVIGDPDPFRLRYRAELRNIIGDVVRHAMNQEVAVIAITKFANEELDQADRKRFIEVAETELLSLHEGNFARYQIRPSEFTAWQERWSEKSTTAK